MSRAGRSSARNATRPTRSPPAGRASSAWPRKRKSSFPTFARSCCRRTRRAGSRRCAVSSTRRRAAPMTSSSARSSSPRGTISRFSPSSAWSTRTSASPTPIRARPSARSSSCVRRPDAPGAAEKPGRALLQTWQPEHPVIAALMSGDAERFYREETEERRRGGLPPFGRLAAIIVSAEDRGAAEAHARLLAQAAHRLPGTKTWRVAPLGGQPQDNEIILAWSGRGANRHVAQTLPFPTRRQGAAVRRPARIPARRCWPRRPSRAAGFALRSTSIRKAFCEVLASRLSFHRAPPLAKSRNRIPRAPLSLKSLIM